MRNNQNLPNRRIDSNNVNERQLPSTSPIHNNSRSRTPYRSQSRSNYNSNPHSRDNRNYQGYRKPNDYNNRSVSYNKNNYSRNRSDTTIADQARDTQTEVTQDNNQHTIEIITIIITIINRDTTVETQIETIDTDNVLVVTTDITRTIVIETIEGIRQTENKITDITRENNAQMETNIIAATIEIELTM